MNENIVEDVADMFQALAENPGSNEPDEGDYTIFVGNPKHHDGKKGSFVLIDKEMVDKRMLSSIEIAPEDILDSNLGKIVTATERGLVFTFVSKKNAELRVSNLLFGKDELGSLFGEDTVAFFEDTVARSVALTSADHQEGIVKLGNVLLATKGVEKVTFDWKVSVRMVGKPGEVFRVRGGGIC